MPSRDKDSYNIRSVENALLLLEALADEDDKSSLAQLSERLDMTKASLFRLIATFENHGYIERSQRPGEYQLGLAAFEVSQKLLSKMTLLKKARPIMAQLVRQCNETVYLVIQRNREVLFLEMADNDQKVKVVPLTGQRFDLDCCASGKVFLAFGSNNSQYVKAQSQLATELKTCREQRHCIDHNGVGEGSTCIAVPLFKAGETLAGCLALVSPSFRTDDNRAEKELLPALKAAAEMISAQLGYNAYAPRVMA
ncbi:MAG: IclR family transcriptional regulator [Desulfuromonadales bacterium]|nr:IclR family transcriptional regulator [Desulfuromonadales bacterium]